MQNNLYLALAAAIGGLVLWVVGLLKGNQRQIDKQNAKLIDTYTKAKETKNEVSKIKSNDLDNTLDKLYDDTH